MYTICSKVYKFDKTHASAEADTVNTGVALVGIPEAEKEEKGFIFK